MKARIAIIACAALLSSCSIFRSSKSAKQTYERDSTSQVNTNETVIDTSTVTVYEKNDYSFLSPGFTSSSKIGIAPADLLTRLSTGFISLDTAMLAVSVSYDTLSRSLNIKAVKRPEAGQVHQEKTTVEKRGGRLVKEVKQQLQVKAKAAIEHKESKPDYGWIPWMGMILAVMVAAIFGLNPLLNLFKRKPDAGNNAD